LQKFITHGLKPGCHFTVGLCTRDPEISLSPLSKIALVHHASIPRNPSLLMKPNRDATPLPCASDPKSGYAIPHRHCMPSALFYQYSLSEHATTGTLRLRAIAPFLAGFAL
jgi:hypothetical protein